MSSRRTAVTAKQHGRGVIFFVARDACGPNQQLLQRPEPPAISACGKATVYDKRTTERLVPRI